MTETARPHLSVCAADGVATTPLMTKQDFTAPAPTRASTATSLWQKACDVVVFDEICVYGRWLAVFSSQPAARGGDFWYLEAIELAPCGHAEGEPCSAKCHRPASVVSLELDKNTKIEVRLD